MFFKNLCIYRLDDVFTLSAEAVAEKLADFAFQPVARTETVSRGWVPPLGRGSESLVHAANGRIMLCLQEEQRLLPPAVIRETLDERVAEREEAEYRKLGRREKARMKDEITLELLPQAFTRTKQAYAYIDPQAGYIVVDSATWKAAETLTELLRACLGSLPIGPLQTAANPQRLMTDWLARQTAPANVDLGDEAILEDPQREGAEVRVKRHDLDCGEIRTHISGGKRVRRLAVTWRERMGCVIDADLSVKRLKFLDVVQEEAADREAESATERFDADFAIMGLEFAGFIEQLIEWFGGEPSDAPGDDADSATSEAALVDEAERVVRATANTSVSHLQRRLGVDFNQADRLLGTLAERGVVSTPGPDGQRAVLAKEREPVTSSG